MLLEAGYQSLPDSQWISGSRWPIHPIPYQDEDFNAYVLRLLYLNMMVPIRAKPLFKLIENERQRNSHKLLSSLTGLEDYSSMDEISQWDCDDSGFKWPELKDLYQSVTDPWITEFNSHFKFCPLCLKESVYFRNIWRERLSFICVKHKVLLKDYCLCKQSIPGYSFNEVEPWFVRLSDLCPGCGRKLSLQRSKRIDDPVAVQAQIEILRMTDPKARFSVSAHSSLISHDFFYSLRLFYALVHRLGPQSNFFREPNSIKTEVARFKKYPNFKRGDPMFLGVQGLFNYYALRWFTKVNYVLLRSSFSILLDWPKRFFELLDGINASLWQIWGVPPEPNYDWKLTDWVHYGLIRRSPPFICGFRSNRPCIPVETIH